MKKLIWPGCALIVSILISFYAFTNTVTTTETDEPKLVVGVVIDQMRYEYLERFYDKFGENGFKKLMREGYNYRNTHYNYLPTETGPGHAAIFSGATPSVSGVIGNYWYDRNRKKVINVVGGMDKYLSVGVTDTSAIGRAGPDNMLVTTVADEIKKRYQLRNKTITVSIKDRGAILPGGHTADGAYWFDPLSGRFITSNYYMDALPQWVNDFNSNGLVDSLNKLTWNTSLPLAAYTESRSDDNKYERKLGGKTSPTFPYDLQQMNPDTTSFFYLPYTPFGNDLVERMAEAALTNEKLGSGNYTDFLGVSFSSTDYIGHAFGPYSVEVEDTYLKLDQTIARFLSVLDQKVGKDNYVFFLTADHGVLEVPHYIKEQKLPTGIYNTSGLASRLTALVQNQFKIDSLILYWDKIQIYLDQDRFKNQDQANKVTIAIKKFLEKEDMALSIFTREELFQYTNNNLGPHTLLKNTFIAKRSGDIFMISKPSWLGYSAQIATSHGAPFPYDTHVPLLWYGKSIPVGKSVRRVSITDIAPTVSFKCGVMMPSGSFGLPLVELFE